MMKRKTIYCLIVIAVFAFIGCNLTPAKVQQESARVAPQVQEIASAVSDQELSGDGLRDWIALIQAGNAASVPFNPYAVPVGAGLALLTAVMGAFAKKKNDEAAKFNAKYQSHKQGVELTLRDIQTDPDCRNQAAALDKALYENIGKARANNGV